MTYYTAALRVLRSVERPLTTREIVDEAVRRGLISPHGKTPYKTMGSRLYAQVGKDPELVKLEEESGSGRPAKRGSVRWTLRRLTVADPARG